MSDLLKLGEEFYDKKDKAYEEPEEPKLTAAQKKAFLNGEDVPDGQAANPWSIQVEQTEEEDKYKKEHPINEVPVLNKQLHENGCSLDSEYTEALSSIGDIITAVVAGDTKARERKEFTTLNFPAIKAAIEWLVKTNQMTSTAKVDLMHNAWMLNFKAKPPTPEEFISEKYIGDQANSLHPWVKDVFADFFDPLKPYRTLVLTQHIGAGKAQPYSSKVAVGREPVLDFDFGDNVLTFAENDLVLTNDGFIEAKNVTVDFPVLTNLVIMSIYDCRKIDEFAPAFEMNSYNEIVSFFKKFKKDFFIDNDLKYHRHHITPRSEGGTDTNDNLVLLPIYFHIKAHYLRGTELEAIGDKNNAYKNYKAVQCMLDRNIDIPKNYKDFLKELDIVVSALQRKQSFDKKTKYVYNGKEYKRVLESDVNSYIKDGWVLKGPSKNNSNKTFVNKNGKNFFIEKSELNKYLENGYIKGMFKTEKMLNANCVSYSTLGTKWVHKNNERKCVKLKELDTYLNSGWVLGSNVKGTGGKKGTPHKKQGMHWWTDGKISVQSKECPGDNFIRGRVYENK